MVNLSTDYLLLIMNSSIMVFHVFLRVGSEKTRRGFPVIKTVDF
jgi:hypothetical protein